jgi:hypothetical protein
MCGSATKPSSARRAARVTTSFHLSLPKRSCSSNKPATSPGTPTDWPRFSGATGRLSSAVASMAAGAVSRKSSTYGFWSRADQTIAKPPPPRPLDDGLVKPATSAAHTAASNALPPAASTRSASLVAPALSVATA